MDKTYKITLPRRVYSLVLIIRILGGVLLLHLFSFLLFYPPLPKLSFAAALSYIILLFEGLHCTGDRNWVDDYPRAARTPPLPRSTLAMSLTENWINEYDGSDEAPLRWLKLSAMFSLYCSSLYSGVPSISIVPVPPLQEVGRLVFTARQ